jgi:hypothetical protein
MMRVCLIDLFLPRLALRLVQRNAAIAAARQSNVSGKRLLDGKLHILPLHVWVYLISDTERRRIIARRFDWCASILSRIPLRKRTVSMM